MGIKLVTYAGQTVTSQDDALIYESALTSSGMIYGGLVSIKTANTLHIAAAHGALCGRKFTIDETDVPVALTASGSLDGRLYIHMDLSDADAPIQLLVETAASLTPVVQDQNVNINNGVYEINLATFTVDTSTIDNLDNVAPQLESVGDLVAAKQNSTDNSLDTTSKQIVGAINEVNTAVGTTNTAVNNKHKVTSKQVTTSSWSEDTTSQSGTTLYKKSISLSHVYVDSPSVDIGAASGSVLPTAAQQTAYDLLSYVTVDSAVPCLYLYATAIPEDAFYINVEGVD
jgi:hypothetical protein